MATKRSTQERDLPEAGRTFQSGFDERCVPGITDPKVENEHLSRYSFAKSMITGGRVLDAGCGVGYGSHLLAENNAYVVGIDLSAEAAHYARGHWGKANLGFAQADCRNLPFKKGSFNWVCTFEFIEHITEQSSFLEEVRRVLGPGGRLIISTPNYRSNNPFHQHEIPGTEFRRLLRRHFSRVTLWGQRYREKAIIQWIQNLDFLNLRRLIPGKQGLATGLNCVTVGGTYRPEDIIFTMRWLHTCQYLIAICEV